MVIFNIPSVADDTLRDLYDALNRSRISASLHDSRTEPGRWKLIVNGPDRERVRAMLNARQLAFLETALDPAKRKLNDAHNLQADIAMLSQKAALVALGVESLASLKSLQGTLVRFILNHQTP